jgi:hypothetical protein
MNVDMYSRMLTLAQEPGDLQQLMQMVIEQDQRGIGVGYRGNLEAIEKDGNQGIQLPPVRQGKRGIV